MFDLVLKNARIYDGLGSPFFFGDLAVKDEKIAAVGRVPGECASRVIDVSGKALAPGFVDTHTHSDRTALFVNDPDAKILQGVTTEIAGNCGQSIAPLSERYLDHLKRYLAPYLPKSAPIEWNWNSTSQMLDRLDSQGHITDIVPLVGHGTVRMAVMGAEARPCTNAELEQMKAHVTEAMESGCVGISTGLIFPPGCYAEKEEIVELCKVVARYGGIYCAHIRGEAGSLLDAFEEAIDIAEKSGCSLQISHHKVMRRFRGWSEKTLGMMERARERGLDVTCDAYPYPAGSNNGTSLLPPWANAGGVPELMKRLKDAQVRERIKADFLVDLPGWDNHAKDTGWDRILIGSTNNDKSLVGKTFAEIAEERRNSPEETYLDIILSEEAGATIVILSHSEEDMENILRHPLTMIGSDSLPTSISGPLAEGNPHPRAFGCYPRVLGLYAREKKLFSLEEAIRKCTGMPATRFRLFDRGVIREGMRADLVVFDPATVKDNAEYRNSRQLSTGIDIVFKNGRIIARDGRVTGPMLGKSVRV
jgi:N-acyl-D-amino-acid deacylase